MFYLFLLVACVVSFFVMFFATRELGIQFVTFALVMYLVLRDK